MLYSISTDVLGILFVVLSFCSLLLLIRVLVDALCHRSSTRLAGSCLPSSMPLASRAVQEQRRENAISELKRSTTWRKETRENEPSGLQPAAKINNYSSDPGTTFTETQLGQVVVDGHALLNHENKMDNDGEHVMKCGNNTIDIHKLK